MANQADVFVKNVFTDNIRVYRIISDAKRDFETTIANGEEEKFYLAAPEVSLVIEAPHGVDTRDYPLMVKSDVDLAISCSRTDSNWKLKIAPNNLPIDVPVSVNVNVGLEEVNYTTIDSETRLEASASEKEVDFNITQHLERLRLKVSLPALATYSEFKDKVVERIKNIDNIYTVFALLSSSKGSNEVLKDTFDNLLTGLKLDASLPYNQFRSYLTAPLRIKSVRYGSPASVDILGLGKIFDIIRELIKDLVWRGRHEKEMAKLSRQKKEQEIKKDALETEKATLEILSRRIELLKEMAGLDLPNDIHQQLAAGLLPEALGLTENSVTILTENEIEKTSPTENEQKI